VSGKSNERLKDDIDHNAYRTARGLAMVCFGGQASYAKDKYYCMTDDGNGRMRPCSSQYKKENPTWPAMPA